jgi:hypothetical protein
LEPLSTIRFSLFALAHLLSDKQIVRYRFVTIGGRLAGNGKLEPLAPHGGTVFRNEKIQPMQGMKEEIMSDVVYTSKSRIEHKRGPLRIAHLPGESQPVIYSVHGAIAAHYKIDPAMLKESHSSTIDYVISATAG